MQNKKITINSRKFDNSIHRSWNCEFLEETADYWLFVGEFEFEVNHQELGIIRRGTISYEYYQKQKWFNIFRFHEPEGDLKFYYCNLNMPPTFENNVLDYVDLDLDILVRKDFSFEILDADEFQSNSLRFEYPEIVKVKVQETLEELIKMIKIKSFPFDFGVKKCD